MAPDRPAEPADTRDSRDLAAFGYKQELARTLGSFSSFAAGFSYISILTGIFQLFFFGFGSGGPAFFWTWPLVFLGQFLVALCFAELAAHYPLSGSVYQWSKQIGHRAVGWMAGWVYLACLVISIAAVALAIKVPLVTLADLSRIAGVEPDTIDHTQTAVLLGCLLITFTTLINSVGVGLLAKINNLGVFSELLGAALLIILLAAHAVRGPNVVFETGGTEKGHELGYLGAFLAAALMASYVMYGFDTAGSLAEETTEPRRKAPRAILQALAAAGAAGGLLLLFALMAVPDLAAKQLADQKQGLFFGVKMVLGADLTMLFVVAIIVAITVCTLAVHTGAGRLIFGMARDNKLPFGAALSRVSAATQTPVVPILISGLIAVAILLVFDNFSHLFEVVASVAVLWANLAYLFVTVPLLFHRLKGWPPVERPAIGPVFSLGRWGLGVNVLASVWGMFMVVNMGWPRPEVYGKTWYEQYSALLLTAGLLIAGGLYYGLVQRHKTGVLQEHRVDSGGNPEGEAKQWAQQRAAPSEDAWGGDETTGCAPPEGYVSSP
jgi:urea carboxylase system permease